MSQEKNEVKQSNSIGDVLKIRPFLFLWGSQILSQVAFNLINFLLVIQVYELTKSNTAVSALILAFQIPQLLVSLPAGVVVDRLNKRLVMFWTNIARSAFILILIISSGNLFSIYFFSFFISLISQFFTPAEAPTIPRLVPTKLLLAANSLFTITLYASIIVGFVASGAAFKVLGLHGTFFIGFVCFLFAAVCNFLLPRHEDIPTFKSQIEKVISSTSTRVIYVIFRDLTQVIKTLYETRNVAAALFFMILSQGMITVLGALLPGFAATILNIHIEDSSFVILAPAALGMVVGSFIVGQMGSKVKSDALITPGVICTGIFLALLPVISQVSAVLNGVISPIALVVMVSFILGIFNAMIIVPANTIVQEDTDPAQRGSVYGVFGAFTALFSLLPLLIAGILSDLFTVGTVLILFGGLIVCIGIIRILIRKGKK